MRRIEWAGLLEVLAVILLGLALAGLGPALLGLELSNPLATLTPESLPPSWLPLVLPMLQLLLVQYGAQFLVIAIVLIVGRRWIRPADRPGRDSKSTPRLVLLASLATIVAFPPVRSLMEAGRVWDLAPAGPPWRETLLSAPLTGDFYVFMAVMSFGVVPVLEEALYRGYVQGRLQATFRSSLMPLVLTSVLFTFLHSQYFGVDAFSLATTAMLFGLSMVLGILYWQTGSLLPSILVHALINLPMSTGVTLGVATALTIAGAIWRKALMAWIRQVLATIRPIDIRPSHLLAIALMLATALLIPFKPLWALALGPVFLVVFVVLGWGSEIQRGQVTSSDSAAPDRRSGS
jgi:membrane protease YdiL (CAAX protease family)